MTLTTTHSDTHFRLSPLTTCVKRCTVFWLTLLEFFDSYSLKMDVKTRERQT